MDRGKPAELDAIVDRLRDEFVAESRDRLERLDDTLEALEAGALEPSGALRRIRQDAHNLKGMGSTYGFPLITVIAHRLEDYLGELDAPAPHQLREVGCFVDSMRDVLNGGYDDDGARGARMVRGLPVRRPADFELVRPLDIEVLMAMPPDAVGRYIEAELQACGYRVIQVTSSFDALEFAVRTRPDLVVVSALLDALSGTDLARALASIRVTAAIPVALVTSFPRHHPELRGLPPATAIVRKDGEMVEDLAAAITALGLADIAPAPPAPGPAGD